MYITFYSVLIEYIYNILDCMLSKWMNTMCRTLGISLLKSINRTKINESGV